MIEQLGYISDHHRFADGSFFVTDRQGQRRKVPKGYVVQPGEGIVSAFQMMDAAPGQTVRAGDLMDTLSGAGRRGVEAAMADQGAERGARIADEALNGRTGAYDAMKKRQSDAWRDESSRLGGTGKVVEDDAAFLAAFPRDLIPHAASFLADANSNDRGRQAQARATARTIETRLAGRSGSVNDSGAGLLIRDAVDRIGAAA